MYKKNACVWHLLKHWTRQEWDPFSFLYVSYSFASFSVSHSIAKSVHTLQCVYSAILIWLPQSFCIYLKWLEVEYVFLLFLFRRNFVINLEMWYVFCKMQYMCPFCKMFFTDYRQVNLLSSSLQTFLLRTTEERSVEVLN